MLNLVAKLSNDFYLCLHLRFFKGSVKNYHIRNNDGYFLRGFDVDTGSTYMTYEKESQTKFPNVTDLIDFLKYTSDKSKYNNPIDFRNDQSETE